MGVDVSESSSSRRIKPAMNITPLVDVVLVLLIIFMVVTPMMAKQVWLNVPPKADDVPAPPPDAAPPIVLTLAADGTTRVNDEVIPREELPGRLVRMLNARADKVVFFDADSTLEYGRALEVIDLVRSGGVETVAVLAEETPTSGTLAVGSP
jgi:biopolymer transport protein ExbD